jgi:hypothetical protein
MVLDGDMNTASGYLENIIAVSAGESHSMALDVNGFVWIWGDNNYGQLGTGDNNDSLVPVRVKAGLQNPDDPNAPLSNIVYISAGYWHSIAVDSSGRAWVWGMGANGKLGSGSIDDANLPVPLAIHDLNVYNETQDKWYKRIQPAINGANNNDVIVASEGCYCENLDFDGKSITLKSVDPNNWSVVDNTRIYGSPGATVIYLTNDNNSVINGLTIIGGDSGIFCNNGRYTNPIISHCKIRNTQNSGILVSYSSNADIINNIIYRNSGVGIVLNTDLSVEIRNNTIVYNSGYGIYEDSYSDTNINSNIIWGNGGGSLCVDSYNVNYNCIQNYTGGTGNIDVDPCFVDANNDNYHLKIDSNCIDKGDPNFNDANQVDIDGENRIIDGDSNGTATVDIGADEYWPFDMSPDGIVDFFDFAVFAGVWGKSAEQTGYNDRCDFYNDGKIDYKDLELFCAHWLYISWWDGISGEGAYSEQMIGEGEGESMEMQPEQEFMMESQEEQLTPAIYLICDDNTPEPNEEVTVQIYSDAPLFCMGLFITITGDAEITDAISTADCNEYGWDPDWPTDPYIDPDEGWLYVSGVKWEGGAEGVVGYFKFRYNSGQVSVSIMEDSAAYDSDCEPVGFSTQALMFESDPNE